MKLFPQEKAAAYDPSSEAVEVVGPQNTDYLNQIATFRLARNEVDASDTASTTSPRSLPTRPSVGQQHADAQLRDVALTHATASTWSGNLESTTDIMQANNDFLDPPILPLSQEDYLAMAGEIGDYMNWDGSYLSTDLDMVGDFR